MTFFSALYLLIKLNYLDGRLSNLNGFVWSTFSVVTWSALRIPFGSKTLSVLVNNKDMILSSTYLLFADDLIINRLINSDIKSDFDSLILQKDIDNLQVVEITV